MRIVKFTQNYSIYNRGEVAGFEDGEAKRIVDAGAAAFFDPNAKPAAAETSAEPAAAGEEAEAAEESKAKSKKK